MVTLPAAGPSDVTVAIPVLNDVAPEPTETLFVKITPATGYRVYNDGSATAFIRDNDSGDRVMVSTYNDTPAEGGGTGRFYIHRAGATTTELVVNYSLSGTATSGVDYTGLTGTATIPAGEVGVNVPFAVSEDIVAEGTETVTLQLVEAAGSGLDLPSVATFEIGDNDALPITVGFQSATSTTTEQLTALGEYRDIAVVLSAAWPIFALFKGLSLTPHSADTMLSFHSEGVQEAIFGLFDRGSFGVTWYVLLVAVPWMLFDIIRKRKDVVRNLVPIGWGILVLLSFLFVYLFTPNVRFLLNAESYYRQMMIPAAMLILSTCVWFGKEDQRNHSKIA